MLALHMRNLCGSYITCLQNPNIVYALSSDLCIRHKKVFSHEHILYPPGTLPLHLPSMHGRPSKVAMKEIPEGGVHPLCEFCKECFFSDDELYSHMRERHEDCFVCKRNGIVHQ